jgi:metal-responsive CopG/Arc/MetJ family transcriptional regulator
MKLEEREMVKTTILLDKKLLDEIDRNNPFSTRKEFLKRASQEYLIKLRRRQIDEQLAEACSKAHEDDLSVNDEWEAITLENWP